jgi:hypothetical protein
MLMRTQISLEREMLKRAKRRANEMGMSLAQYIRSLIARDLGSETPIADRSSVFDLGDSGGSDIARNKDAMIADAIAADRGLR